MQRSTPHYLLRLLACAALLGPAARAAELGDVSARSFIGQPLVADIELVALAADEAAALQVRLAQPDVFRGANITMNPALSSVRLAVVKRDQRQFVHVTTTGPVDAEYVHLYMELGAPGRSDVRLATVWLRPDPNPAPPPPPPAAPVPPASALTSAEAARITAQARAERAGAAATGAAAAASPAGAPLRPVRDRSRPAPLPSAHESEIGVPGAVRAAAPPPSERQSSAVRDLPSRIADAMGTPRAAPASSAADHAPSPVSPAVGHAPSSASPAANPAGNPARSPAGKRAGADGALPLPVAQALLPMGPLPLPAGVKRPAAPAACAPSGISAKECRALDTHNAALTSKLAELEGKMKALQGALKNAAPAAALAAPAAPAAASAAAPVKAGTAGTVVLTAPGSAVAAAVASPPANAGDAPKAASAASAAPSRPATAPAGAGSAETSGVAPAKAETKSADAPANPGAKPGDAPAKPGTKAVDAALAAKAARAPGASASAPAPAGEGASASASAATGLASASATADGRGASVSASADGASASASAPVALKRVLPKLKYKKEKPVEKPVNYVAWGAGALGALLVAGAGLVYWRRKKSGAAPLKIWQGFRKKKPAAPQEAAPLHEVTPESIMQ
nr:hypothetical protein [uncultured Duganella sp.]